MLPTTESAISRQTAAELLGVPPETTPAEARTAFLKRLERADFQPSAQGCAGCVLLAEIAPTGGLCFGAPVVEQTRQQALRQEVEVFGRDFWSLEPIERAERCRLLQECCDSAPALGKYLEQLSTGLDVEAQEFAAFEGRPAQIAVLIKDTFPLRPLDKVARQREWLGGLASKARAWADAARELHDLSDRLASLEPRLMRQIQELPDLLSGASRTVALERTRASTDSTSESFVRNRKYVIYFVVLVVGWLLIKWVYFELSYSPLTGTRASPAPPIPPTQYGSELDSSPVVEHPRWPYAGPIGGDGKWAPVVPKKQPQPEELPGDLP